MTTRELRPDRPATGINVLDRIAFWRPLTVMQLREVGAAYGIRIRPKASRDDVAAIFRNLGVTDDDIAEAAITVLARSLKPEDFTA